MAQQVLTGLTIVAAGFGLAGCDLGGGDGAARQEGVRGPGSATELVEQMIQRGRLPQRDYLCGLAGGERAAPYGTLGIANDRYTFVLKGGGREEGSMTLNSAGGIVWEGDLGRVDDEGRRVSEARINSEGQILSLTFDVAPAVNGHARLVCTAEA